jgi:hypothetical protein
MSDYEKFVCPAVEAEFGMVILTFYNSYWQAIRNVSFQWRYL